LTGKKKRRGSEFAAEAQRRRGLEEVEEEEEKEEVVHAEGAENAEGKSKRRRGDMLPRAEAWHRTRSLFPLSVLRALCVNLPFPLLLLTL